MSLRCLKIHKYMIEGLNMKIRLKEKARMTGTTLFQQGIMTEYMMKLRDSVFKVCAGVAH